MSKKVKQVYPEQIIIDLSELSDEKREQVCNTLDTFIDAFHMLSIHSDKMEKGYYRFRGYHHEQKR